MRTKRGQIAFKVGLDKGSAPCEALFVVGRKKAVRATAARSKTICRSIFGLAYFSIGKRSEFLRGDTSGQALG
jgi:hypothetical protein